MDFNRFREICRWIFELVDTGHFSFDDCIEVFSLYFDAYRRFTGTGHPVPNYSQILTVMERMPFADVDKKIPLELEDYKALIPAYFLVQFPDCDYGISHFFSGRIRELRYYETMF